MPQMKSSFGHGLLSVNSRTSLRYRPRSRMLSATSLELTLRGAKDTVVASASTVSMEAHNAYLQAHFYFVRRNLDDYRKAVGFFDQAIRIDPDYALAYAERSEAWTFIGDLAIGEKKDAWAAAK